MAKNRKLPKLSKAEKRQRRRSRKRIRNIETNRRFVEHPRYGSGPIRSATPVTEAEMRAAYWGYARRDYDDRILFPETAIKADIWKQNCGWGVRRLYVDIARTCKVCRRWFIFHALEQKHWYETLGFFIDADCVECQECRHTRHEMKAVIDEYQSLLARLDKSYAEHARLEAIGQALYETGYIRKEATLQRSRVPRRLRKR